MLRRRRQLQTKVHKVVDALLCGAALWLAHAVRSLEGLDPTEQIRPFDHYSWLLLLIVPLAPAMLEINGFYSRPTLPSRRLTLWQLAKASFWLAVLAITASFFREVEGARGVARGVLVLYPATAVLLLFLKEELVRRWLLTRAGSEGGRRRVILVGGRLDVARLEKSLDLARLGDVEVAGRIDLNDEPVERLADLLHEHSANAVLIAPRQTLFGAIERAIQMCELEGVEVWLLADFFQTRVSQTTVDDLHGHPMLVFRSGPDATWQAVAKAVIDFTGAAVAILCTLPVMVAAALAVKLTSPGPVLFRQRRAGLNGRPFTMLKFRSMVTNAEQLRQELDRLNEMSGPVFKVSNDPRVTAVGRFLRKWSLDELPQLFNVLRGDMSLVGPRPLPVDEVARFDDLAHRRRLSVKPGLTCLWQISGRNNVTDFREWVRLDLEYIDNWSLWLDLKILFRTIPAVLTGAGAK